jgi:3D (Asp-Asp-Asp) domain-containing protein
MTDVRDSQQKPLSDVTRKAIVRRRLLAGALGLGAMGFCVMLGWSAAVAFQRPTQPIALTAIEGGADATKVARPGVPWNNPSMRQRPAPTVTTTVQVPQRTEQPQQTVRTEDTAQAEPTTAPRAATVLASTAASPVVAQYDRAGNIIRVNGQIWTGEVYDGKPIRPVRTVRMLTTAYSPDERSCGKWADGITASGMSVWTNGMKLVAADRSIPFGTLVSVPGYNNGRPVPVLDRGGAIKGNRLDLLYPTHEVALQWGAQRLDVVVWEYVEAD